MTTESIIQSLTFSAGEEGEHHITINEGAFIGTTYKYGRVWFPDEDEPILSFDYDVISEPKPVFKEQFETLVGEILVAMIKKSLEEHSTVFAGGTDEVQQTTE